MVFDEIQQAPGATDAMISEFVAEIRRPLSQAEVERINRSQQNPFPRHDPLHASWRPFRADRWTVPERTLPSSYLSLLRWSNGGWCRTGEREFGFFPALGEQHGVRAMMLAYHLPEYMPGALPIAFNGGGTFYVFDMRRPAVSGEYPVVCVRAGNLGWDPDECWRVADTFLAACRGPTNVDDLRDGEW